MLPRDAPPLAHRASTRHPCAAPLPHHHVRRGRPVQEKGWHRLRGCRQQDGLVEGSQRRCASTVHSHRRHWQYVSCLTCHGCDQDGRRRRRRLTGVQISSRHLPPRPRPPSRSSYRSPPRLLETTRLPSPLQPPVTTRTGSWTCCASASRLSSHKMCLRLHLRLRLPLRAVERQLAHQRPWPWLRPSQPTKTHTATQSC